MPDTWLAYPTWGPESYYIVFAWRDRNFTSDYGIYYIPRVGGVAEAMNWWDGHNVFHPDIAPYGGELLVAVSHTPRHIYKITRRTNNWQQLTFDSDSEYNDDPDWWHPSSYSVQPQASQLTTTWGDLKKK